VSRPAGIRAGSYGGRRPAGHEPEPQHDLGTTARRGRVYAAMWGRRGHTATCPSARTSSTTTGRSRRPSWRASCPRRGA